MEKRILFPNWKRKWKRKKHTHILSACVTHRGNIREKNEDNFYYAFHFLPLEHNQEIDVLEWEFDTDRIQTVGVFDGMGGESAGELASFTSVSQFQNLYSSLEDTENLPEQEEIKNLLIQVSNRVSDTAVQNRYRLIGSTATLLLMKDDKGLVVNLGDSPMYRLRDHQMELMTFPHTDAWFLEQQNSKRKPALTQFLGIDGKEMLLEPYMKEVTLERGDIYLLCSDGLTDMVSRERIQKILSLRLSVRQRCCALRDEALENGGRDNITIILCEVTECLK